MYKFNGQLIFVIDDDSDRFESFKTAEEYFRNKNGLKIIEYYGGGWNTSYFKFEIENIYLELIYMDFGGTELKANDNISCEESDKVLQWVGEIYKAVHNNEKPK
jgi:hypothetical protein